VGGVREKLGGRWGGQPPKEWTGGPMGPLKKLESRLEDLPITEFIRAERKCSVISQIASFRRAGQPTRVWRSEYLKLS
jgi:hypothetical protein